MTYGDVMSQILSEVTGQSKEQIQYLLDIIATQFPGKHKLDEELPDKKAEQLLNDLRKEGSGILAWLVRCGMLVGPPKGHA